MQHNIKKIILIIIPILLIFGISVIIGNKLLHSLENKKETASIRSNAKENGESISDSTDILEEKEKIFEAHEYIHDYDNWVVGNPYRDSIPLEPDREGTWVYFGRVSIM